MCRLRNIAMPDYQETVTIGQTHGQTPDKVISLCAALLRRRHKIGVESCYFGQFPDISN